MKIAIVGAGISGLTAAYLLNQKHDITVYEKAPRLGGHTASIPFELDGREYVVDTGFIVFNERTYPNFIRLLSILGVEAMPTSMGFSVTSEVSGLAYAGNSLDTLFAQRKNLFSKRFIWMVKDILRFNRSAQKDLASGRVSDDVTLGVYLEEQGYSAGFIEDYLIPMGAAIWSASFAVMREFPLAFFIRFFDNHGLLDIFNRPKWYVIKGSSSQYLEPLSASFKDRIVLDANISSVTRGASDVQLHFEDKPSETYDHVVFANHSNEALTLLADASVQEKQILGDIPYQDNSVVLHYDEKMLPENKKVWSSWNYQLKQDDSRLPVLTYNMNILQKLDAHKTFCVTLNADEDIDSSKVIGRFCYAHPQFSMATARAQSRWQEINNSRSWFCGAYWGNGFHEDGVTSAIRVAKELGVDFP